MFQSQRLTHLMVVCVIVVVWMVVIVRHKAVFQIFQIFGVSCVKALQHIKSKLALVFLTLKLINTMFQITTNNGIIQVLGAMTQLMDYIIDQKFVFIKQIHLHKNTLDVALDILWVEIELVCLQLLNLFFGDPVGGGTLRTKFQEFCTISAFVFGIGLKLNISKNNNLFFNTFYLLR